MHLYCVLLILTFIPSGTHDIQNATVFGNSVLNIVTEYFKHSNASGALYTFVFLDGSNRAVYLALDRSTSLNHTLPFSLSAGRVAVSVYDIESDGTLASGVGYPAVSRELVISATTQGIGEIFVKR